MKRGKRKAKELVRKVHIYNFQDQNSRILLAAVLVQAGFVWPFGLVLSPRPGNPDQLVISLAYKGLEANSYCSSVQSSHNSSKSPTS